MNEKTNAIINIGTPAVAFASGVSIDTIIGRSIGVLTVIVLLVQLVRYYKHWNKPF